MTSLPTNNPSSRKMLEWSQAANRPKRFKQEYPADRQDDGQEQGNLTHPGSSSILKNSIN